MHVGRRGPSAEQGTTTTTLAEPDPTTTSVRPEHRFVAEEGETASDLAQRLMSDVLGDPATVVSEEADGGETIVTMETASGAPVRATFFNPGTGTQLRLLASPGLSAEEANGLFMEVPEPGAVTVTGYDFPLNPPGETMVADLPVEQPGRVGPIDIPESSWLRLAVATSTGSVLHYLAPR